MCAGPHASARRYAAKHAGYEAVRYMMQAMDADFTAKDSTGKTALHLAANGGQADTVPRPGGAIWKSSCVLSS